MKLKFSILRVVQMTWYSYSVADCACWSRPGLCPKGLFLSESIPGNGRTWSSLGEQSECHRVYHSLGVRVWASYITELVFVVTMLRIEFMADFWGSILRDYFYRHPPISGCLPWSL